MYIYNIQHSTYNVLLAVNFMSIGISLTFNKRLKEPETAPDFLNDVMDWSYATLLLIHNVMGTCKCVS